MDDLQTQINSSWKKEAAAMAADPMQQMDLEAFEIERAFMDQAYNYIQGKAGPLLKPEYRLGFEVVYKNEKNTRMVGIFAFRVDNELLFIPVFFVSSNIKGTDLLYRSKTKLFMPLTEDWCKHVLGQVEFKQGDIVDEVTGRKDGLNIDRLVEPPETHKWAKAAYAEMKQKLLFEDESEESLKLSKFLKEAGAQSLEYVKHLMEKDAEMAEAAYTAYGDLRWIPDYVDAQPRKSEFSIKLAAKQCAPDELEEFFKQGYAISEKRAEDKTVNSVAALHNYKEGAEPGLNWLLDQELKPVPVILFESFYAQPDEDNEDLPAYVYRGNNCSEVGVGTGYCNAYCIGSNAVMDVKSDYDDLIVPNEDTPEAQLKPVAYDKIKAGNAYLITSKDYNYAKSVYVSSVEKKNNVMTGEWTTHPEDVLDARDGYKPYLETFAISGKASAESISRKDIFAAKDIVILPIDIKDKSFKKENVIPFTTAQMKSFLKMGSEKLNACSINYDGSTYDIKIANVVVQGVPEITAKTVLMKEAHLSKSAAEAVMEEVQESNMFRFYAEKKATSLSFADFPEMNGEEYDSLYDVMREDSPQIEVVEADGEYEEPRTIEELLNAEKQISEAGPMAGMHPMQVADISERTGVRSIFDHGVIGSLAKTFDSRSLIDNYIPDLEVALDKLGRLLFLFYWKPEDFLELYGTDDQDSLENTIVSNFKAFGELVLELKNKNQQNAGGSTPLPA